MVRRMAATLAAIVVLGARAAAATDEPTVRSVPLDEPQRHWLGNACLVAGVALIAASFEIQGHANHRFDDYLAATEPDEIGRLYDRTVTLDRWSSGTLIGGEVMMAGGLYLRFLRRPSSRVAMWMAPDRCAVSYHF